MERPLGLRPLVQQSFLAPAPDQKGAPGQEDSPKLECLRVGLLPGRPLVLLGSISIRSRPRTTNVRRAVRGAVPRGGVASPERDHRRALPLGDTELNPGCPAGKGRHGGRPLHGRADRREELQPAAARAGVRALPAEWR